MKRKISILCSMAIIMQLLLSSVVTVSHAEAIKFTVPNSPATTYNMNLDWKYFRTGTDREIQYAMSLADKDGKKFYEKDYNDASWTTVSIPHAIAADNAFMGAISDAGGGYERGVYLYRKTFTVPATGSKFVFELEGIRQAAYVWVNGQAVGYYEAGITAFGFDITNYVTPGEQAVIAICEDGTTARGTTGRIPYETVPGQPWGSSYTPDNYKTTVGGGAQFQWNTKDFNEAQVGLVYDAYLHVTGNVYQTLPLYNNLKTTGNYIYGTNYDIRDNKATINVKSEIRNESNADGNYTLDIAVVDHEGNIKYSFASEATEVKKATDAGVVYETAVESDAYDAKYMDTAEETDRNIGSTKVNTPDVTYINASYNAEDMRFWSLDDPYQYTVYTMLKDSNGNVVDVKSDKIGFRKVSYSSTDGLQINDKVVFLAGYAQRSTNEWAVVGSATDWLADYDMRLVKSNNANFIRWMHVAPKPAAVRASDKYGVAVVCPAGDKEGTPANRSYTQRAEAMRDAMIYFRNSASVIFWETGNSTVRAKQSQDLNRLRNEIDPYGMRFMGSRSTTAADQLNYDNNYAGTMYGNYAASAKSSMTSNGKFGPIMETEYARDESPRRVWDDFSPPDYDYVNQYLRKGNKKTDGYDIWDLTQEEITVANVGEYNGYYNNRVGNGSNLYAAAAMMTWSDSNMHGRNTATENARTSGRVDVVRQEKEMFYGTQAAQSSKPAVHIIGHWSYPELSNSTYNYFEKELIVISDELAYWRYTTNKAKRDPLSKPVYVIGSIDVKKVELYRIDGESETLLGTDQVADNNFIYKFDGIDITKGDGVIAKAYNARGELSATHLIPRTYEAASLKLEPVTAPEGWVADGSDIAFFDVKVLDRNGNVCALNYDKITFTALGDGVYLGGYNSGTGANCFQNTVGSTGISGYFGGAKDGVSTLNKTYVYAENGTNRIFVRSTRNAGIFSLTASMDGLSPVTASISSEAIPADGGLSTQMPRTMENGVEIVPPTIKVVPLKPLMKTARVVDWANAVKVKDVDNTVFYKTTLNGTELSVTPQSREGINRFVFGPIVPILDELKAAGADFTYTYDDQFGAKTLAVTAGGHVYRYVVGRNLLLIDGFEDANSELTEDMPTLEDGVMIAQLSSMLGHIPGVSVSTDYDNLSFDITFTNR